jgi:antitoxin MazE
MKTRIVRIGNSRGIRIPKPLIEQTGISEEVIISVKGNTLVISPASPPRAGWAEAFARMALQGDDAFIHGGPSLATQWDEEEWEW